MIDGPHTRLPVLSDPPEAPAPAQPSRAELAAQIKAAGLPIDARKPPWLRVGVPGV